MIALNRIHRMDAFEGMAQLPDNSVDLIVTDPPYNIASAQRLIVQRGVLMSTQEAWGRWDTFHPFDYDLFIQRVLSACYRVLKPGGALYMFTAREDNGYFVHKAVQRGFTYRNQLVMVRKSPLPSLAKKNFRSGYEVCLYITKGKPGTFNFLSQAECNNVYPYASNFKRTEHPTEKPLEVIRRLVLVSSQPGDLVLDPFMGSGTTAVACVQTGRRFVGFEKEPEYVRMAKERFKDIAKDTTQEAA